MTESHPPTKLPLHPKHPERVCWGCDQYCPAKALACGNGTERTPHPAELFGDDWYEWAQDHTSDESLAPPTGDDKEHDPSANVGPDGLRRG